MATRMTVCYPNGAIIGSCKPRYDARGTAIAICTMVNAGYIKLPEYADIIRFTARGTKYTAKKNAQGTFQLEVNT
jgi:hypothetical protein